MSSKDVTVLVRSSKGLLAVATDTFSRLREKPRGTVPSPEREFRLVIVAHGSRRGLVFVEVIVPSCTILPTEVRKMARGDPATEVKVAASGLSLPFALVRAEGRRVARRLLDVVHLAVSTLLASAAMVTTARIGTPGNAASSKVLVPAALGLNACTYMRIRRLQRSRVERGLPRTATAERGPSRIPSEATAVAVPLPGPAAGSLPIRRPRL